MNAAERLQLLIPWLNGDRLSTEAITDRLFDFLEPQAWARGAVDDAARAYTYVSPVANLRWPHVTDAHLRRLRRDLLRVLTGTEPLPGDPRTSISMGVLPPLRSLRFAVTRRTPRQKTSALVSAERRAYRGAGAHVVLVNGRLRDVLLYVVMRLLTAPGAVAVARCPAPAPGNWTQQCGRLLVAVGPRRGRPATYCSDDCRVRDYRKREAAKAGRMPEKPKAGKQKGGAK